MSFARANEGSASPPGVEPLFRRPILLCLTGLAQGGLEAHVLTLAREFQRRGDVPFHIICHFDAWFMRSAVASGLPVTLLPLGGRFNPSILRRFEEIVRRGGFGLIHAHDRRVLLPARRAARHLRLPLVSTYHGWVNTSRYERFANWLDLRLRAPGERFIAVSPLIAEGLRSGGVAPDHISTIPNAADSTRFQSLPSREEVRRAEGLSDDDFVIGSVGRLSPEKGPDVLIRAFAEAQRECPRARLVLVGDGPLRSDLESLARELGVADAVRFAGFREDIPCLMRGLDVFANPSRTEGTPQSLIEAMWAGLPIVATRVGGVPSLVDDGHEALLTPSDAVTPSATGRDSLSAAVVALAQAMLRLHQNPALRTRLADAAHHRAQREFSSAQMAERTLEAYRKSL